MSNQEPLVSILMPYYNLGGYLLEAVKSVLAQSYSNWELIVVDDCSTVEPASQVLAGETDPRIRTLRHEQNSGCGIARNTAASKSNGEYLLPLDSDDLLAPTYIEKTLRAARENEASAAYTQVKYFGKTDKVYTPIPELGKICAGHYPCNTLLVKREVFEAVGGYKKMDAIEDTEFWISIIEAGTKFAYVPEPLYQYRCHDQSMVHTRMHSISRSFCEVLLMHKSSVAEHLQQVLEGWCEYLKTFSGWEIKDAPKLRESATENDGEYAHLQAEFAKLKNHYETLERRVNRQEKILASVPSLTRQLSYIALKRVGLR